MNFRRVLMVLACASLALAASSAGAAPLAQGKAKFLGGIYSPAQAPNLADYFNQVTPENAGKWGSVEATRDVMQWSELDAAYNVAKSNGFVYRHHVLVWGNQQPAWIESLAADQQLIEIGQWFDAVAARYPAIDYLEVVNEATNDPPNQPGNGGGNYLAALGGSGTTGWDWVRTAFRMARKRFPATTKLMLNDYNITTSAANTQRYLDIINILKAENLIDAVGVQQHAFETRISAAVLKANLDLLATAGLPIVITEMDIDGPTEQVQLDDYKRIFPVLWEHPMVVGITLWGYRPGLWRDAQGAALIRPDGSEKPALQWLRTYLAPNSRPIVTPAQSFYVSETSVAGAVVGTVQATDADGVSTLRNWQIAGGTGASIFAINTTTGQLTVAHGGLNATANPSYTLDVTVSDGIETSAVQSVVVNVLNAAAVNTRLVNISTRAFCGTGNNVTIGGFVIAGSVPKRVLIRAVGPSLRNLGISLSEALLDPMIEVHRGVPVIAANDNWTDGTNAAEITSLSATVGAFPLDPTDTKTSALVVTLDPGVYSFVVSGKGGTSGIVLLEVYDADAGIPASTFVNIASRAFSTTGNGVTIGGFVISGSAPRQVLLRAVGPTLEKQGVGATELLADPMIELHSGPAIAGTNDNWLDNTNVDAIRSTAARIGASPLDASDTKSAAMLLTLPAGAYSFIASGKGGSSGIVLVEVYDAN